MNNIEILEDKKEMFIDTLYECYRQSEVKPFEKAIENLIQENKELKEENNKLKSCEGILDAFSLGKESSRQRIEFDYIPKSKIEDVINNSVSSYDCLKENLETLLYGEDCHR